MRSNIMFKKKKTQINRMENKIILRNFYYKKEQKTSIQKLIRYQLRAIILEKMSQKKIEFG